MPNLPSANQTRTILLAPDDKNSIHAELAGGQRNSIAYAPYGQQAAQQERASHFGFNGELCERIFGWYLLGNGYRAYNPILMRFHCPDSWSPFGKGGFNAYGYCGGDPRTFTDPTGHFRNPLNLLRRASPPPSPPPPRIPARANVYVAPPTRPPSVARELSAGDALRPPPSYSQSQMPPPYTLEELPSYSEVTALTAQTRIEPALPNRPAPSVSQLPHTRSTSQTATGFMVEPRNPGSSRVNRTRPAEITILRVDSIDPNVPPLPPPRRVSEHVVRHYSLSRNPDGTWSHSSREMVNLLDLIRRGQ
ncbi:RHS repeat-associated core domain-containing protein [Pseudomonas sp. C2B4]|uniref:RHS repeat-associated core domain-containing protein n=1 Tax=Pseudomonas sp. C2B4 TaxID=2735270 RepID=UPI0015867665|nr:RHS repeat-associated core domain-containing protein [Pseudomonas sp. C2B4]